MKPRIDPDLTKTDKLVLGNLFQDIELRSKPTSHDAKDEKDAILITEKEVTDSEGEDGIKQDDTEIAKLQALNDASSPAFQPTVFTIWEAKDIHPVLNSYIIQPWARLATGIVRHPTDVVFLTHILGYLITIVPSAIYLFRHFTWTHGILHTIFTMWCAGPFTLMLHNHIHNGGVLRKDVLACRAFDKAFPYVLEPLMGHTWDSYYYHHVKHHHVEGNGPDDLSSTIRYQRDDPWHFAHYFGRFFLLVWLDLPSYFLRKGKPGLALRACVSELVSYVFMFCMTYFVNARAATFTLLIPFVLLRFGLMVGNWGQHALVDEVEPDSDFRSSITLIDVASNRHSFNDGYHTAHHLNPRRHWREHPVHFLQQKSAYSSGRALVFHDIDYIFLTIRLLMKDYAYIAQRLVPITDEQMRMSQVEIEEMLKTKTRQFSEEEIAQKWK